MLVCVCDNHAQIWTKVNFQIKKNVAANGKTRQTVPLSKIFLPSY